MAETTRNLGLPLIAAAQAQKHVTHNEALTSLDALVQLACLDKDLASPPADPAEGDRYLVAAPDPTGAWAGFSGRIACRQDGVWIDLEPRPGWLAFVLDEAQAYVFAGAGWVGLSSTIATLQNLARLGLGTSADADNPFAMKLNKALWTARGTGEGGSGDLRCTLNKSATGNVLSLLWQTGFSGRAEFGLIGSDDLALKVSPDGAAWATAFTVARADGQVSFEQQVSFTQPVSFAQGALREELTILTASGSWAKPAWARTVAITAMGGGGGGGSGRRGAAGTVRAGGGGGGAGALNAEEFAADELPATLTITIGAGGGGGAGATTDDTNGTIGTVGGQTIVANGGSSLLIAGGGGVGGAGTTAAGAGGAAGSLQSVALVGAGGGGSVGAAASIGGNGVRGAGGGGGAGGLSAANAAAVGGGGGFGYLMGGPARRAATVAGGGIGLGGSNGANKTWARGSGSGGGGGGAGPADASGAGGAGGTGGIPGGGGGAGGGATNGASSGAGGTGGRGEVWILARG